MRAMILAAGRGQRMGALTEKTPKPLLKVAGRYLIEFAFDALRKEGIREVVINVSYLKDQIKAALGTGEAYGLNLVYSEEEERLETGGGIVKALPLLGKDPFIVLSSDILTAYPLARLRQAPLKLAHLMMVKNPAYNLKGDYALNEKNALHFSDQNTLTFGGIGIYRPELFASCEVEYRRLADIWKAPLLDGQITGESYSGLWYNLGTPQELLAASQLATQKLTA